MAKERKKKDHRKKRRTTRRITKRDRLIDHENAMKGVAKWKRTPTGARRAERVRTRHGWGFNGRSPRTKKRKYKNKA